MKWIVFVVALFVLVFFAAGLFLSLASREGAPAGLAEGGLKPCPPTPNCVCSECRQEQAFVLPIACPGDPDVSWVLVQRALVDLGGTINRLEEGYLAATFRTPLFRFVDDVELRLDRQIGVIHIRSASRVGRSDLGTNRSRVEAIRRRFKELAVR